MLRCKLCNSLNIKLRKTWQSWWLLLRNTSTTSRLTQAKGKRKRSWENIYKHCTQRRTTIPPPKSIFNLISGVRRGGGGSTPGLKISGQAQVVSKILNDKRYFNTAKNFRVSASCSNPVRWKFFNTLYIQTEVIRVIWTNCLFLGQMVIFKAIFSAPPVNCFPVRLWWRNWRVTGVRTASPGKLNVKTGPLLRLFWFSLGCFSEYFPVI